MKKCSKCNILKNYTEFRKNKLSKDGLRPECKNCAKKIYEKYYQENKEEISKKQYVYNKENSEKVALVKKKYYNTNKEIILEKSRAYRQKNENILRERQLKYRKLNSEKISEHKRQYYSDNKEKITEKNEIWRCNNLDKVRIRRKFYQKRRRWSDPIYRFIHNIRVNIITSFKRGAKTFNKNSKTTEILGCSWETFKEHIESKFTIEMNWDNHGQFGWHLDHIIPISSAKTLEDIEKLCHYTNYQPLWWRDNLEKSDKIIES
jgi:hypothetical protein